MEQEKGVPFLGHHGDLLDALLYMVRNVQFSKNPYPDNWNTMSGDNVYQTRFEKVGNTMADAFKGIMNMKKKDN